MTNLKGKIEEYKKKFAEESARVRDEKGLAELRNEFLGRKKGCLTSLFEEMKGLSAAEKPGGRPAHQRVQGPRPGEARPPRRRSSRGAAGRPGPSI